MISPLDRFKKPKQAIKPFLRAENANLLFAEQVVEALGLRLEVVQGRHVELENGMRGTYRGKRLIWCHKDGTGIGDNCALAMAVTGLAFRDSLELLLGYAAANPVDYAPAPSGRRVLRVPGTSAEDAQSGREYLRGRGVSDEALSAAEACRMLRYEHGAVLFVGYDEEGNPKSATRRGYLPTDPTPKRDLAGTDKSWPALIRGEIDEVWVVEGGVDALALMTLRPNNYPTLIVSGGVHVTSWLENPSVIGRLTCHRRCVVAGEREKDTETQTRTDEQRRKLVARLQQLVPEISLWMPPAGRKDLGEMLSGAVTPEGLKSDTEGN